MLHNRLLDWPCDDSSLMLWAHNMYNLSPPYLMYGFHLGASHYTINSYDSSTEESLATTWNDFFCACLIDRSLDLENAQP